MTCRALSILFAFLTLPAFAFESRLLDASGKPVAGAQVSVVDHAGSARTDGEGRFTFVPDPRLPATLIVIGSRGELFPPVYLERFDETISLLPAFRESVTVSSGATPNIEGTPAAAPVIVGAEEIEQRKPAHVAEAIATTPGVALRGEGPAAVPVVRGLAGGRTLLLIDDARVVAERRAGPSATFLDPLTLGSIEVSRGPGSVAYGSDAIGGVIHMRPRDPVFGQPEVRYDVWASFGATQAVSGAIEASTNALGGAVLASLHARTSGDSEDAAGVTIENSQYRDHGALLRYVRDAEWGRLRAGLMTSVATDVGAPSSDSVQTIYPDERATLLTLALDGEKTGVFDAATFRASLGSYSITTNRVRSTGTESATVKARDASFRFSGETGGRTSRLVTGIDFVTRFDLRAPGSIDDADRYDAGVYASWDRPLRSSIRLGAGARADYIVSRTRGGFFENRSRRDTALSGYLALTAGPFRAVTTTLQIASGYREPSLSDRYFRGVSGRGFVTGNPELEPERSVQFDAAARWTGVRSRVAMFAYSYAIQDLVERYRQGADFFFRNRGEGQIRGLELEAATRLFRHVELEAGASVARGEDADTGAALDDIAPLSLHSSLRWAAERASAFITVSAFARDDEPGPLETERPGHTSVDIGGGWRVHPKLEVRVVIRNATNSRHFGSSDAVAAMAPGRSVMIGINR